MPLKTCPVCSTTIDPYGRGVNSKDYARRRFCSVACRAKGQSKDRPSDSRLEKKARRHKKANCETCGTADSLQVHHVDHDKANNDPSNLMTLCVSCHTRWHWQHGKKERDRRYEPSKRP